MYPTVSVVDVISAEGANGAPDGERLVVWHVQTAPDAAADALSGAWIFGDGTGHSIAQAADVVSGTVMLSTPGTSDHAVLEQLGVDKQISVDAVIKAMEAELKRYKVVAIEAKKNNPQLTLPRFEAIRTPDLDDITAGFHGEPEARDAWAYATAVAELVEQWNAIESQRKTRKYLQEEFGADVRPLPVAP